MLPKSPCISLKYVSCSNKIRRRQGLPVRGGVVPNKANLCGQPELGAKISKLRDSYLAKKEAWKIKVDANSWNAKREDVLRKIIKMKFDQNPALKDRIAKTKGHFYECTLNDYWACGYPISRTDHVSQAIVTNNNKLGKLLEEYRDGIQASWLASSSQTYGCDTSIRWFGLSVNSGSLNFSCDWSKILKYHCAMERIQPRAAILIDSRGVTWNKRWTRQMTQEPKPLCVNLHGEADPDPLC